MHKLLTTIIIQDVVWYKTMQ